MKDFIKTYFTVAWIVAFVLAILFALTGVGIIFSIPLFIAMMKFKKATKMTDQELIANKNSLFIWGIILSIALFETVVGLVVGIVLTVMVKNHIEDIEKGDIDKVNKSFEDTVKEGTKDVVNNLKDSLGIKTSLEEKLAELDKLKEKGTITEEEYQIRRQRIISE